MEVQGTLGDTGIPYERWRVSYWDARLILEPASHLGTNPILGLLHIHFWSVPITPCTYRCDLLSLSASARARTRPRAPTVPAPFGPDPSDRSDPVRADLQS